MESERMTYLPTELLVLIFLQLSGRDIHRCRRVCVRWKQIIDTSFNSCKFWRKQCQLEHENTWRVARAKSQSSLSWSDLYKSLCLWGKLDSAKECWRVIVDGEDVRDVHIWKGNVSVLNANSIVYYDLKTPFSHSESTDDFYMSFEETDDIVLLTMPQLNDCVELTIVPKVNGKPQFKDMVCISKVSTFIIFKDFIYYERVTSRYSRLAVCSCKQNYKCKYLRPEYVKMFSVCGDALYYLSETDDIYRIVGDKVVLCDALSDTTFYHTLKTYNLLHLLEYRHGNKNPYTYHYKKYDSAYVSVHTYGNLVFVSKPDCTLNIYDTSAWCSDQNTAPVKRYELKTQYPSISCIKKIDVAETLNGHIIVLTTPEKILALDLTH